MDVQVRRCQMKRSPNQPTNEAVRDSLKQEIAPPRPPSPLEQIRRELGWNLIKSQRGKRV